MIKIIYAIAANAIVVVCFLTFPDLSPKDAVLAARVILNRNRFLVRFAQAVPENLQRRISHYLQEVIPCA